MGKLSSFPCPLLLPLPSLPLLFSSPPLSSSFLPSPSFSTLSPFPLPSHFLFSLLSLPTPLSISSFCLLSSLLFLLLTRDSLCSVVGFGPYASRLKLPPPYLFTWWIIKSRHSLFAHPEPEVLTPFKKFRDCFH